MKSQRRYKDLEAEEINHQAETTMLTITLPSGKSCKVDSRNLIIDEDRYGAFACDTLACEGIAFYRTRVMQKNVKRDLC